MVTGCTFLFHVIVSVDVTTNCGYTFINSYCVGKDGLGGPWIICPGVRERMNFGDPIDLNRTGSPVFKMFFFFELILFPIPPVHLEKRWFPGPIGKKQKTQRHNGITV